MENPNRKITEQELEAELKNSWIRRIKYEYESFNWKYLQKRLVTPSFDLIDTETLLGRWEHGTRTIYISEHHIRNHRWEQVMETLRHEMAHQYVTDVLKVVDEGPHGPAFKTACKLLRCSPEASTERSALLGRAGSPVQQDKRLERIEKLMRLGESPFEKEAQLALKKAAELILEYNLEVTSVTQNRHFVSRCLGQPQAKLSYHEKILAMILREYYFVEPIYTNSFDAATGQSGRVIEISGTPVNVELAEYAYAYLIDVMQTLWNRRKTESGVSAKEKNDFLTGVMKGFREKLSAQRTELSKSRDLIWTGDPELKAYYKSRYPKVRSDKSRGPRRGAGFEAGRSQGQKITIAKGVTQRTSSRKIRLLPPK